MLAPLGFLLLIACSSADEDGYAASPYGDEDRFPPPSEADARAALQSYFDRQAECTPFFDLPRDVPANDDYTLRQMRAFVDAGLLRESAGQGQSFRFAATPVGERQIRPGTGDAAGFRTVICYGRRKVGKVQVGEPDAFMKRVSVKYRYVLADVPAWAKNPSVIAFYPVFAKWLSREAEANEDLEWNKGGWMLRRQQDLGLFDFRQQSH